MTRFLFSSLPKPIFLSITALGISATVTQVVALREFLSVFYGNELVIGVILANWLFLTGLGTILGKKSHHLRSPITFLSWAQLIIAVLPILSVTAIRLSKTILSPAGEVVGLLELFLASGLVLAPYCLLSGFIHPLACVLFSRAGEENRIGEVYFLDVLGDILGGLLFSLVLVFWFNSITITYLLFGLNLAATGWLSLRCGDSSIKSKRFLWISMLLACTAVAVLAQLDWNRRTVEKMFPRQEVLSSAQTPYGFLVATRTGKQVNIYENGLPVFSSRVAIQAEENVHYTMLQHPNPKRILLVSGGTGAVFREIAKYLPDSIDYVELDPQVVEWNRRYGELKDSAHIRVINQDGRLFIKETGKKYDVILLCLPEPHTAALNRYFTVEFYQEARRVLAEGGVLGFGLVSMSNYFNTETRKLISVQFQSLKSVFPHVDTIPGSRVFFVAGNIPVSSDIPTLLEGKAHFTASFLTPEVLKGFITPDRVETLREAVEEEAGVNRDFSPTAYFYQLLLWLKIFEEQAIWLVVGLGVLLILFVARLGPETLTMFNSGFSGSCLSVTLILMFQALYGYVYFMLGLLVTAFMVGMAAGTMVANLRFRSNERAVLIRLEWVFVAFAFLLPVAMAGLSGSATTNPGSMVAKAGIPLLLLVLGWIVGIEFSVAGRALKERVADVAGRIYSADYFGAAFGAILASVLLVPMLGLYKVSFAVGLLHLISLFVLYKGTRRIPISEAAAMVGYIGFFGYLMLSPHSSEKVYVLSYHPIYIWAIVLFLLLLSLWILLGRKRIQNLLAEADIRLLSVIGLVPMIFLPIFKCWFIIPFLFCHVCPRKCVFGFVRPFAIPMVCLQNLHHRIWCARFCPVGILQDAQCPRGHQIPASIKNQIRFGLLAFFVLIYFWIEEARRNPEMGPGTDLFLFLFTNNYAFSASILVGTLLIFLVSFWIKRFFCDLFCPVGAFGALTTRLDQALTKGQRDESRSTEDGRQRANGNGEGKIIGSKGNE